MATTMGGLLDYIPQQQNSRTPGMNLYSDEGVYGNDYGSGEMQPMAHELGQYMQDTRTPGMNLYSDEQYRGEYTPQGQGEMQLMPHEGGQYMRAQSPYYGQGDRGITQYHGGDIVYGDEPYGAGPWAEEGIQGRPNPTPWINRLDEYGDEDEWRSYRYKDTGPPSTTTQPGIQLYSDEIHSGYGGTNPIPPELGRFMRSRQ
jgi:hypothetical protein